MESESKREACEHLLMILYVEHDNVLQMYYLRFSGLYLDDFMYLRLPDLVIYGTPEVCKSNYSYSY